MCTHDAVIVSEPEPVATKTAKPKTAPKPAKAAEPKPAPREVSREQQLNAVLALRAAAGAEAVKALLTTFGVARAGLVPDDRVAEFVDACEEAIAAHAAGKEA